MARVLVMPEVAANATAAVLQEWLVLESATYAATDTLATVETDKALVDVEADAAGVVLKTLVPAGTQVDVGSPIAVLGAVGEVVADLDALLAELGVAVPTDHAVPERRDVPTDPGSAAPLAPEPELPAALLPDPVPDPVPGSVPGPAPTPRAGQRVFSSPLARRIAATAGLAVEDLRGTGPRGRVLRRDVERAIADRAVADRAVPGAPVPVAPVAAVPATPAVVPAAAGTTAVPHTRLRRAIADRLVESKRDAPHFYLRATVRAEPLLDLRAQLNDGAPTRVSLNDLVLKAVAAAHLEVPQMNVVWTADALLTHASVDIAVAVATDRGLLTPVVRDVAALPVRAVAARVADLAERARTGRLRQDELEGGTISVTNLGMHGVEEFAAIINPPHAAILAVGAVRDEPVVEDGAVVAGRVLTVTLSVDHRPVDGVVAGRWLAALTRLLTHPVQALA